MRRLVFLFLIVLNFGWSLRWGLMGADVRAPLLMSVGMSAFMVADGWRHPGKGVLLSGLIGTCFTALANLSLYFVGRWAAPYVGAGISGFIEMLPVLAAAALGAYLLGDLPPQSRRDTNSLGAQAPVTQTRAWRVARGIGGFVLFLTVDLLAGGLAGALILILAESILGAPPEEGSTLYELLHLCLAVLTATSVWSWVPSHLSS
jgi:hypothetical protein